MWRTFLLLGYEFAAWNLATGLLFPLAAAAPGSRRDIALLLGICHPESELPECNFAWQISNAAPLLNGDVKLHYSSL
jgi:hypothetical protein